MMINTRNSCFAALLSLLCAFAICVGSVSAYAKTCKNVRSEVLRLHVIANSDSEVDQNIKLLVRDRLLAVGADCFASAADVQQAVEKVEASISVLTDAANAVLVENRMNYTAQISIKQTYFETRTYEDVTLPAGNYLAVRVVLGSGEGKNWWCVMFPPLCLPAATQEKEDYAVFADGNAEVIAAEEGYAIRFKIVEWIEELRQLIREKRNNGE